MSDTYKGKLFSLLGDSISTLAGYSEPGEMAYYTWDKKLESGVRAPEDTWWGEVIARLGGELLCNNSILGSTVTQQYAYEYPSYGFADERVLALGRDGLSPDVIMVFMGTNDWGAGVRVEMASDTDDASVFSVAYGRMLVKLRSAYPTAEIWCLTLPVGTCSRNESFEFPYRYGGIHIEEYCDAICRASQTHGCRTIDLYRFGATHDTLDGFHPNKEGMHTLAEAVLAKM